MAAEGAGMRIPITILVLGFVLAEIAGFILVGKALGVLATLALTVLATLTGVTLLRHQGLATLERAKIEIRGRQMPARPLFDGALQALAALLMIIPGFITDIIGLALFVPALRDVIWRRLAKQVEAHIARRPPRDGRAATIVELEAGDFRSIRRPDSPWRADRRQT
jgi:UPF0716 protein FxsA